MPGRSTEWCRRRIAQKDAARTVKISERRAIVLKSLREHRNNPSSTDLRRARSYRTWLRLNDHRTLPAFPSSRRPCSKKFCRPSIILRDAEIAEVIRPKLHEAERELKRRSIRRVTVNSVLKYLAPTIRVMAGSLKQMPKTNMLIQAIVETKENGRARRVAEIVSYINHAAPLPIWSVVVNKYGVFSLRPSEQFVIRSAYLKRNSIRMHTVVSQLLPSS
jgi:hypothetical protein